MRLLDGYRAHFDYPLVEGHHLPDGKEELYVIG